jgi:cytochrome bd-type quinol oxidase subunit 2
MKSATAFILWLALAGLGAIGLADALRPNLTPQAQIVALIAYAGIMACLPAYSFLRHRSVRWPIVYAAIAVVSVFAGSLLLVRSDSISEGTAFLAMGVSIFVAVLLRGFKHA